jgi:hypothetical protein
MDVLEKSKISCLYYDSNLGPSSPERSHYIDPDSNLCKERFKDHNVTFLCPVRKIRPLFFPTFTSLLLLVFSSYKVLLTYIYIYIYIYKLCVCIFNCCPVSASDCHSVPYITVASCVTLCCAAVGKWVTVT